jgi:mono/diheme cytochrome c family protein
MSLGRLVSHIAVIAAIAFVTTVAWSAPTSPQPTDPGVQKATFSKDIAPILFSNCVSCHRAGEVAPFTLMSFRDAKKHAKQIAQVTKSKTMPPWKAEAGYGEFVGERRLTAGQIELIDAWVKQGAPEGDASQTPPLPKFVEGWQLGEPDMVVKMSVPFTIAPEAKDVYRWFVLPVDLPEDKYVQAVEFRPSNRKIVHHSLFFLDSSGAARELDGKDGQPGWSRPGGPGFTPTGGLGGWSPGVMVRRLPEDVGRPMKKGSDIVLQMHFHPSGKVEHEQSTIGLYFAKKPTDKLLISFPKGSRQINIAPGDNNYRINESLVVPAEVTLQGIIPHAHLLCRDIKVDATFPDGHKQPLIWIKDWDWDWQEQYQYKQPIRIPSGTRLDMQFTYDNSAANLHNPSNPPQQVVWGEQTNNEMCLVFFQIVADRQQVQAMSQFMRQFLGRRAKAAGAE